MTLLADLEEFVRDHRPHGELTGDATAPAWNGDLLTVTCPCGVMFGRWVTPMDADRDLISWRTARRAETRLGRVGPMPWYRSAGSDSCK
jgi:hypothetical protein